MGEGNRIGDYDRSAGGKLTTGVPRSSLEQALTVKGLAAWLETQPPETEYPFCDRTDCLIARYLKAAGFGVARVGGFTVDAGGTDNAVIPLDLQDIPWEGPRTYAAALTRARAAVTKAEGAAS